MRKQFKNKLRSCKLCKPHKMGWAIRWKEKDAARLREAERAARECVRDSESAG
jgi:hypothetical protein